MRAGMTAVEARRKASLLTRASAALGRPAATAWFVPGRIEFLGKHTDYAGGRSLLCTAERGLCVVAAPRVDAEITVTDAVSGSWASFSFSPDLSPAVGDWSNYPMTVARRIARNFHGSRVGADIAFASDLPPAAGLSSSSALIIAMFLVLADVNGLRERREYRQSIGSDEDLAAYLGTVENGQSFKSLAGDAGVGTFGGSQDHAAILCARPRQLVQFGFSPVRFEGAIPLPAGTVFVIAASGVVAEKTRDALAHFNHISRIVSRMVELWRDATGGAEYSLAEVVDSSPDASDRLAAILRGSRDSIFSADVLLARLGQFLAERSRLIPATAAALAEGKLEDVGDLVDESQALAETGLGNQVPETIFLAAEARGLGAIAASSFGAGFGGSVWALIDAKDAETFRARWSESYRQKFPDPTPRSSFFITAAGPAAMRLL